MVTPLGAGAEFDLIRSFLAGRDRDAPGVRVGPGDDCAVVTGEGIAVTVDMCVEDVHFRRGWVPPGGIGHHAAAAAISDLAAMAARPIGVLASVALGPGDEAGPGAAVMDGVARAVEDVGGVLLGGDVTRSPGPMVVDIVALGETPSPVLRSGARPGDEVWVTGRLGAAAAAVEAWLAGADPPADARTAWAEPRPRVREALWLAARDVPSAMVDLSDGIAGDAAHVAAASGVRLVIEAALLPVAGAARGPDALRLAAAGGEDYELCFTAAPGTTDPLREAFEEAWGLALTRVGRVEAGRGAVVVDGDGVELPLEAYQHWRRE